jgi:hypothetical protein
MKLNCFLICDDIRNELGKKQSLMGIYDDVINFSVHQDDVGKWPRVIRLGIYIKLGFENEAEKDRVKRIRLEYSMNDETVVLMDSSGSVLLTTESRGISIGAVVNQFVIKNPGELNFHCIIYDKDGGIIHDFSKKITAQETIKQESLV